MKTETLDYLQGITISETEKLKNRVRTYRELLAEMLGTKVGGEENRFPLIRTLSREQLRGAEHLCTYLDGQEDGGAILDEIFQDAQSFERLSRQLQMVAALMLELDSLAPENDFEGRAEARRMLGNLSLRLKKTARIAAASPGRLRTFR